MGRGLTRRPLSTVTLLGLLLACTSLIAACGGSDDSTGDSSGTSTSAPSAAVLSVTVDPTEVTAGGRIEAVVVNDGAKQYTYGAGYELEQQIEGTWEKVEVPPKPVPDIGYVAPPGKDGPPVKVHVPSNAESGSWRVVISRDAPGGLLSGEFTVADG